MNKWIAFGLMVGLSSGTWAFDQLEGSLEAFSGSTKGIGQASGESTEKKHQKMLFLAAADDAAIYLRSNGQAPISDLLISALGDLRRTNPELLALSPVDQVRWMLQLVLADQTEP